MIKRNLSSTQGKFTELEDQESPSNVKFRHLTDKMSYYTQDLETESQTRTDIFSVKLRSIDDKVSKLRLAEEAKMNVIAT